MRAREGVMKSPVLGDDLKKLYPISFEHQSDTATFDNALELLTMSGYPLAHAAMMMIPEAWEQHEGMDARRRAFYEYHAAMLEPWTARRRWSSPTASRSEPRSTATACGPRATSSPTTTGGDGQRVGRAADSREPHHQEVAPAAGQDVPDRLEQGRIVDDEELKNQFAFAKPYRQWIENVRVKLDAIEIAPAGPLPAQASLLDRQQAFGYTQEDLKFLLSPMAATGEEGIGSMGNDSPLAVLSDKNKPLYNYFKQLFAQVTNRRSTRSARRS